MLDFCTVSKAGNQPAVIPAKETVQKTLAKPCYMWKTLAGLAIFLGSCFRDCAKKPIYGVPAPPRHSCERDCATNADSPTIETFESGTGKKGSY